MSKICVKAATKNDLGWINQRYKEVDFVPSIFEKEVIGVAEFEGQKAGIGRLVSIDKKTAELGGMYVFEEFRGKGIAKELVKFLLEQAHRFETIYCIPFEHLTSFYSSFGFAPCLNQKKVPHDVIAKYRWCKEHYPQSTSLLFLQN